MLLVKLVSYSWIQLLVIIHCIASSRIVLFSVDEVSPSDNMLWHGGVGLFQSRLFAHFLPLISVFAPKLAEKEIR